LASANCKASTCHTGTGKTMTEGREAAIIVVLAEGRTEEDGRYGKF